MENISLDSIPKSVKNYLNAMDEYDEPCLILINADKKLDSSIKIIDSAIDMEDPYSKIGALINEKLIFLGIDCEYESVPKIISKIQEDLQEANINTHISAFRHNCIGNPEDTFSWCCTLLNEVYEEFKDNSGYKINDFKDRANWPGVDKYMD